MMEACYSFQLNFLLFVLLLCGLQQSLFQPVMKGASKVDLDEPYLCKAHQLHNLTRFCGLCAVNGIKHVCVTTTNPRGDDTRCGSHLLLGSSVCVCVGVGVCGCVWVCVGVCGCVAVCVLGLPTHTHIHNACMAEGHKAITPSQHHNTTDDRAPRTKRHGDGAVRDENSEVIAT